MKAGIRESKQESKLLYLLQGFKVKRIKPNENQFWASIEIMSRAVCSIIDSCVCLASFGFLSTSLEDRAFHLWIRGGIEEKYELSYGHSQKEDQGSKKKIPSDIDVVNALIDPNIAKQLETEVMYEEFLDWLYQNPETD